MVVTKKVVEQGIVTRLQLTPLAVRWLNAVQCGCCGSDDVLHDEAACYQASYASFDLWRSEQMVAGLWHGHAAMSDAEYCGLVSMEDDEEEYAPDFEDEEFFAGSDRLAVPSMGLY